MQITIRTAVFLGFGNQVFGFFFFFFLIDPPPPETSPLPPPAPLPIYPGRGAPGQPARPPPAGGLPLLAVGDADLVAVARGEEGRPPRRERRQGRRRGADASGVVE